MCERTRPTTGGGPWSVSEDVDSFRQRIYYMARDGMAITLYALLADKPKEELPLYLEHLVEEERQRSTPLIIAAKNGHDLAVKMILKFQPNVEQEGTVQLDGYVIEGATALWCAAGAGHLAVVRTLVEHGADVNHPTSTNSTPLRAACFDGRLDIVMFLVEHRADVHMGNKYNNTCLMISAYKGHDDIVSYLLTKGAEPDAQAQCGATALHFAAEHGHLDIVRELLRQGAGILQNAIGMTPLLAAAERTKAEVVRHLVEQTWCSRMERIEALELLGASFANDKDHYNLSRAYFFMEMALHERLATSPPLNKRVMMPILAYDNHIECQTLEELESRRYNANALHMESLVIRERILGTDNPEVPHPVVFRGAVFADSARFDRCIQLWLHALRLRHRNDVTVRKDLLRFAQVFSQMLHVGFELPFEQPEEVLEMAVIELERNLMLLRCPPGPCGGNTHPVDAQQEELDDNIHTILYLLVIFTRLLKRPGHDFADGQRENRLYQLVYRLNRLGLHTRDGSSLLHLAVNADTPVDDFHTKNVCRFPCAATSKLLIHCGADVNALDERRNSPLHVIVAYQKPITDFLTQHSIITALIESGAHMDAVNACGQTPFDAATTGVAEIILRTQAKISLKCIAAKAVKKFNLCYEGHVPHTLVGFIEMHGVPNKPPLGMD